MASRQTGSTTRSKLAAVRSRTGTATAVALAVVCGLTMSACAFQKDPKSKEKSKIEELEQQLDANRPIEESEFVHTFLPQAAIEEYVARVTLPTGRQVSYIVTENDDAVMSFDGRQANSFEIPCFENRVQYKVAVIHPNGKTISTFAIKKDCPIDQVIRKTETRPEFLKTVTGRLVLSNGAVISLGDKPLEIDVEELIVEGPATIKTFDEQRSRVWKEKKPMIDPPKISIRAKKARGTLILALNGIDGAPVWDLVPVVNPALNGKDGSDGEAEEHQRVIGGRQGSSYSGESFFHKCVKQPTSGSPGAPSPRAKGEKGIDGNPGVGTSEVHLEIGDVSAFHVEVRLNPGASGKPGQGSIFKGGKGGAPGANPHGVCRAAMAGADGADSAQGDRGDETANPKCGKIRVSSGLEGRIHLRDMNLQCSADRSLIETLN